MTKKHYFVLKNIDPTEIDAKYGFFIQNIKTPIADDCTTTLHSKPNKLERTKISDLTQKHKEQYTFSYLDESKKEHTCVMTMHHNNQQLPEKTNIHCFWCRSSFDTKPLGCPIQYIPHRIVKTYYSEITKDQYTLRENISTRQLSENIDLYQDMNVSERDQYITDGMFCSFNCCLAYIHENKDNPLYLYSESLLNHIYITFFDKHAQPIVPAPSWKLLNTYGGTLTIDEFRKGFYKIEYKDIHNIVYPYISFRSIGFLFEKQVRI